MAAGTSVSAVGISPGVGKTLLYVEVTKANATDTVAVPSGYGTTVTWCAFTNKSTGVPDPATGISGLTITLSVGTGVTSGLVIVE